jgi:hypothetical protein
MTHAFGMCIADPFLDRIHQVIESYFYHSLPFSQKRHVVITTAVVFSAMIISLLTCDLGIVLELTGGLSATVLAFIVRLLPSPITFVPISIRWLSRSLSTSAGELTDILDPP